MEIADKIEKLYCEILDEFNEYHAGNIIEDIKTFKKFLVIFFSRFKHGKLTENIYKELEGRNLHFVKDILSVAGYFGETIKQKHTEWYKRKCYFDYHLLEPYTVTF